MRPPTLKAAVGAGFVLLLINTGYISAFASPTVFYMTNVLAHLVLGVALAVAFARERMLRDGSIAVIQMAVDDKSRGNQARGYLAELGARVP